MIEKLIHLDQKLFSLINSNGVDWLDPIMLTLSATWIWFPLVAFIAFLFIRKNLKKGMIAILFLILTVIATDLFSVQFMKEVFQRLRPCYDPAMAESLRLVPETCGGQYGFVSTHATNAFGIAMLSILYLRARWFSISIICWALLVSFSRIYNGVHYPGDILGGIIVGLAIGFLTFAFLSKTLKANYLNERKN
jgi:undecaprenyl-diphosphatase